MEISVPTAQSPWQRGPHCEFKLPGVQNINITGPPHRATVEIQTADT